MIYVFLIMAFGVLAILNSFAIGIKRQRNARAVLNWLFLVASVAGILFTALSLLHLNG